MQPHAGAQTASSRGMRCQRADDTCVSCNRGYRAPSSKVLAPPYLITRTEDVAYSLRSVVAVSGLTESSSTA